MRRATELGLGYGAAVTFMMCGAFSAGCASDPPSNPRNTPAPAGTSPTPSAGTQGGSNAGTTGATAGSRAPESGAGSGAPPTTAGAGGSSPPSSGGEAPAATCAMLPTPTMMDDIVSTFEDGLGNVMQVAGRGGGFYMFNDGSPTGMQMPPTGALPPARMVPRCAGSVWAMCMKGSGFTTWGAGMGTDLGMTAAAGDGGTANKNPYDASMYKGITFWAKAAAPLAVRVSIKDKNTAPEGGNCDMAATSGPTACNDDWGKGLSLTADWQPFTVLFADLRQAGWGKMSTAFAKDAAYSIQFQVNMGLTFDMCIDDLAFIR
jgi:hypothetical protein